MLVVAGAPHAREEAMAVAEKLGPGVAKALLGKAVMPDWREATRQSHGALFRLAQRQ